MTKTIKLSNGNEMPQLGYGVYRIPEDETKKVVSEALTAGYRLIDTAAAYQNESGVGAAINESDIERSDIFVTTKLWISDYGEEQAAEAINKSLKNLNLDYIDLLLLHQPFGDTYGAWRAMEQAVKDGKVRNIGVSNFPSYLVQDLMLYNEINPVVNQIEINPLNPEVDNVNWLKENNIVPEAWGPMGQAQDGIFENTILQKIANEHGKTVGQIMLAWNMQRGVVVIPKSTHLERIQENIDIDDIVLSDEEMKQIEMLDQQNSYFNGLLTPETAKTLGQRTI